MTHTSAVGTDAGNDRVAVLGAGSWGTALAVHLARIGRDVRLWGRDAAVMLEIERIRRNARYLTDIAIPDTVAPTIDMRRALDGAAYVVFALPSHVLREVTREATPMLEPRAIAVSAAKGLEAGSLARMSQVLGEELADGVPIVVLTRPARRSRQRIERRRRPSSANSAVRRSGSMRAMTWLEWRSAGP